MVIGWIPTTFRLTKYFGRPSAVYVAKDQVSRTPSRILTDENEILSRWRAYFEDLLNPVKASTRDTHEMTHLGKEEVFTAAEVATAIKGIKSGKAAGEDEIRPEMLKAPTGEGILWLTRVCQVAWKFGKTPRDWQTGVIIPIFNKEDRRQCTNYSGISLLSLPGKVYAKYKTRSSEIRKSLNIEPLPLQIERSQLRWFGHVSRMPQEKLPKLASLAKANGRRPVGRPRTRWTNYIEDMNGIAWDFTQAK